MGIDISARAVALARGLNPELEFAVRDILEDPEPGAFDVVTLLEVIEHAAAVAGGVPPGRGRRPRGPAAGWS